MFCTPGGGFAVPGRSFGLALAFVLRSASMEGLRLLLLLAEVVFTLTSRSRLTKRDRPASDRDASSNGA